MCALLSPDIYTNFTLRPFLSFPPFLPVVLFSSACFLFRVHSRFCSLALSLSFSLAVLHDFSLPLSRFIFHALFVFLLLLFLKLAPLPPVAVVYFWEHDPPTTPRSVFRLLIAGAPSLPPPSHTLTFSFRGSYDAFPVQLTHLLTHFLCRA